MFAQHPIAAGAFVGLIAGIIQYWIILAVMQRVVTREIDEGGDMPGLDTLGARVMSLRRALARFSIIAMPAIGAAFGAAFGGNGGGR